MTGLAVDGRADRTVAAMPTLPFFIQSKLLR